ncbi:hypothetical protein H4219_005313 [Mycoemilia scoparia]|uniref:Secreted protein n=1 Tax=Mycoemilia scoparia TaxID=417184 RepID=A0A9W7ZU78_9FUNG|nr:hypothetical protein H4219_005313 [Mycoemilia scoparia]
MKPILLCLLFLSALVLGIHFDLHASPADQDHKRCLSQWIPAKTEVLIKVIVENQPNTHALEFKVHDDSIHKNSFAARTNVKDETVRLETQAHSNVIVCFKNVLLPGKY